MDAPPAKQPARPKTLRAMVLLLALLPVAGWVWYIFGGGNFHTVAAGRLYRCSQPGASHLKNLVAEHGIQTVLNLRGCCDPTSWYRDEAQAIQDLGISLEDISFSANRLPAPNALANLLEVFDNATEPLLIHCHKGIDRTGMACALWVMLKTDTTLDKAAWQLGVYYGHLPVGRTWWLDDFLRRYREWLAARGEDHQPALLRDWLLNHNRPGRLCADLAWATPPPDSITPDQPVQALVRCQNTSTEPWEMLPAQNAGVHLLWRVLDHRRVVVAVGYAGLFERSVAPGESVELLVAVPPILQPGDYVLRLGMEDPQHATFAQVGGEMLDAPLRVNAAATAGRQPRQ